MMQQGSDESAIDMTEQQVEVINQRWEDFYHRKKAFLRHYAFGDEDAVSIALLAVRKTLHEHPDCPESWLVNRAKLEIQTAHTPTGRAYLPLDKDRHYDADWVTDELECEAMTPLQRNPEIVFIDSAQFQKMWDALGEMERKFLLILREEHILKTNHRWWGGKYAHTQTELPKPKTRFRAEVSWSITDYYESFDNIRYQFYMHFGTDEEREREKAWYASFNPQGRLHTNRDGRYDK